MNTRQRRRFEPEEKVAIVRRHLLEQVPVSDCTECDECGLQPTVFYRWQKELFDLGVGRLPLSGARTPRFRSTDGSLSCKRSYPARTR